MKKAQRNIFNTKISERNKCFDVNEIHCEINVKLRFCFIKRPTIMYTMW